MHGLSPSDRGREIDWGRTSADYAAFRPGYPASFYERLAALGVGRPGQRILDLGTGTGILAREFARRGASAAGIDVSAEQVETARGLAAREGLSIDFRIAPAEATGFPDASFDVVTASQCWLYFDRDRAIDEVRRVLGPGGTLVTCHLCWLPLEDRIAGATEELVLSFNPAWSAAGWVGRIPPIPAWAPDRFDLVAMFWYDEPIRFTRESWRGRIRACRGVGASLPPDRVEAFDRALDDLLGRIAGDAFDVVHRIDAHFLRPS